jgi:serine/threonine-protein kinase RsbW
VLLTLTNARASCEIARLEVAALIAPHQPSSKASYRVEVVLEELLMNQIWHAFPGQPPGSKEFTLAAQVVGDHLVLEFIDQGVAFNPLERPPPTLPTSLDDAVPGGLGILLTRHYALSMVYAREDQTNHLTVELGLN